MIGYLTVQQYLLSKPIICLKLFNRMHLPLLFTFLGFHNLHLLLVSLMKYLCLHSWQWRLPLHEQILKRKGHTFKVS